MLDIHTNIHKSVIKSQHCQRNWDLSQPIPKTDIDLMIHAATQCPSKQNNAFYGLSVVQDRNIIEQIHNYTFGFRMFNEEQEIITNSQVLANILFVFTDAESSSRVLDKNELDENSDQTIIQRDATIALGIASGYLNLTSTMLGYSTGCCQCLDPEPIKEILQTDREILLLMGVGHKNPNLNRRIHHADNDKIFYSIPKEPIKIKHY
jgi:nitroreductase